LHKSKKCVNLPRPLADSFQRKENLSGGIQVNIGSAQTYQRPLEQPVAKRRQTENTLSYDDTERRMEHSMFQPNHILNNFWDVVQNLPKQDQMSLAANVMATQFSQNGTTRENRDFIRSFKNRFSPEDLDSILKQVGRHPLLQQTTGEKKNEIMRTIQELLEVPAAIKAEDKLTPAPGRPLPRSPEEIFFQMSLKPKPVKHDRRVEGVSLGN